MMKMQNKNREMTQKRVLAEDAPKLINEEIKLSGWIQTIRSHGKIIFADLRDASGLIQIVFLPSNSEITEIANKIHPEWVVEITGKVNKRPENMINSTLPTGEVEVEVESLSVLSESKPLPFSIETSGVEINEEVRLKYRYLDLRRERLVKNMKKRFETLLFFRNELSKRGFTEIETPILTKSTPEGARDFLVPSRFYAGEFYALPQSPQQYKQLLMVAGLEKYFQIAKCFRDEDSRANRQAEFTQLDIETSFMSQEEIMGLVEELVIKTVTQIFPEKKILQKPFPVMSYQEAMDQHGIDKPDIRKEKSDNDELAFLWVVDFPMFEWSQTEKKWGSMHHPFTMPKETDPDKIRENPQAVTAFQYDLVLNGEEIGGGSLRSYRREILETVFEILGHEQDQIRAKFGHLLDSFEYGVPPHGGIALGFERFISILLKEENIREVIAFPKAGGSRDLMMNAPAQVEKDQLRELYLKIEINGKKNEKKD
ncbi:MAG: aspartate--tRNA ligase [Minisyncoccales bacterium]|jgi:aspartyl-tRNA synthetase